jgi:DNA-binding transcriptional LysR family regulator
LSQPTVGRRLAALEHTLETRLFDRIGRRMLPTPAGHAVANETRVMQDAADAIARNTTGLDHRLSGTVRISATEGLRSYWITPRLVSFRERYPEIVIEIATGNIAANLSRREADIAVRFFEPSQSDLYIQRMGTLRFGLYASRDYLVRHAEPRTPDELMEHMLVGFEDEMRDRPEMAFLYRNGLAGRFVFRSNSAVAQLSAAEAGIGIAPLPVYLAKMRPHLRRILKAVDLPGREIWLAVHTDTRRTARIAAAWGFLSETLSRLSELRDADHP